MRHIIMYITAALCCSAYGSTSQGWKLLLNGEWEKLQQLDAREFKDNFFYKRFNTTPNVEDTPLTYILSQQKDHTQTHDTIQHLLRVTQEKGQKTLRKALQTKQIAKKNGSEQKRSVWDIAFHRDYIITGENTSSPQKQKATEQAIVSDLITYAQKSDTSLNTIQAIALTMGIQHTDKQAKQKVMEHLLASAYEHTNRIRNIPSNILHEFILYAGKHLPKQTDMHSIIAPLDTETVLEALQLIENSILLRKPRQLKSYEKRVDTIKQFLANTHYIETPQDKRNMTWVMTEAYNGNDKIVERILQLAERVNMHEAIKQLKDKHGKTLADYQSPAQQRPVYQPEPINVQPIR